MPLLKRKAFEKSSATEYLRDDDEVFHCEVTDEIFKDYEEYCERIILVNSMVWTCEMTGKNNLTYAEALESEKSARRSLKDFPLELRIPILFLASKTKSSSFAEMSEHIFNFVRERYFVGESVEACLEGDLYKEGHILSVSLSNQPTVGTDMLPASAYRYEVEQFEVSNSSGMGQMGTAPFDRVRRRKGVFTREKNKLFLKQFVEQTPSGIIGIKKQALEKYNISKVSFDQIFTGNLPNFPASKKLLKTSMSPAVKPGSVTKTKKITPDKKGKQESMDKFLKKPDQIDVSKSKPSVDPTAKKNAQDLAEKMRKAEELMRQRKEEAKALKKEKNAQLQAHLKEWQKAKDDLELEDHKIIPKGTQIIIEGISQEYFGDFLSVLEFIHIYGELLKVKDIFHNDLDFETFRKSLILKEHAGVFSDVIQMFLLTIFSLQEDEAEEYNENKGIMESTEDIDINDNIGVNKAIELATKASKWSQTYLGMPLSQLPLDPTTVSEVLRLHLLSSGAAGGTRCATWRYQQRGGYTSNDDPALRLRMQRVALLARLGCRHVAELPLADKLLILQCLMNQILTYATVRDMIEEKLEEQRIAKHALRMLQVNERKRENQLTVTRQELKKSYAAKKEELKLVGENARLHDEELKEALEKLAKENEVKKLEYEKKLKEMQTNLFDYTCYMGSDRAFRRYWVYQRMGGVFVEAGSEPRGECRQRPVIQHPHVTMLPHGHGSDKENDSETTSRSNSPKKPLSGLNGMNHKLNCVDSNTQQLRELFVCTGDINTCYAHGMVDRPQWWVYHTEDHINGLIQSLNKRGFRERELKRNLELDKANIQEYCKKCPVHLLNCTIAQPPQPTYHSTRTKKFQPSLLVPAECSLSEALELSLRDHILELEEKIFHGCLGSLKVKDREAWRGTLMLRGYDKQAEYLSWGPQRQYRDDYHLPNGVLNIPQDDKTDIKSIPENKYRDPGHYLDAPKMNGVKMEPDELSEGPKPEVVRGLASALLQVSQAVHPKYIKRPLGLDDKERKERELKNKPLELETLERWEVSLMECRSFSQIVLHLFTLDSSITWSASILNASCRLCRRKKDPDNMLLCDGCNKGHHLYCLKPKLTKVPQGDWFCDQCQPKEKTPRKRRKLFSDEELKEALNEESESGSLSDSEEGSVVDSGVCCGCGSGGRLATVCGSCGARFHNECASPKPARSARRWMCSRCTAPVREFGQRRCAATAIDNIHQYTRALASRHCSSESDSDDIVTPVKVKRRRGRPSKETSPLINGTSTTKRGRKSKEERKSTGRKSKNSLTNGVSEERNVGKKRNSRFEIKLHTEALEQLVHDILNHKDCWPFYEPVPVADVPDYLDIIEHPMDFGTIQQKLEQNLYNTDEDLIADAALVLVNCFTYNMDTHPVARAGVRLEKYINKRCAELELPSLPEIILDIPEETGKRTPPSDEDDKPLAKRQKFK